MHLVFLGRPKALTFEPQLLSIDPLIFRSRGLQIPFLTRFLMESTEDSRKMIIRAFVLHLLQSLFSFFLFFQNCNLKIKKVLVSLVLRLVLKPRRAHFLELTNGRCLTLFQGARMVTSCFCVRFFKLSL